MLARRRDVIASSGVAAFNPISAIGWTAAYWAGGPEFIALGTADGAAVASFPDEKSTLDLAQGTPGDRPLYRATGGANSKPALEFDGSGDYLTRSTTPAMSYPFSSVAIAKLDATGASQRVLFGGTGAIGALWQQDTKWHIYAGTVISTATTIANTSWHLFVAYWNGASSKLDIDGTEQISGNAGNTAYSGFACGAFVASNGTPWDGMGSFFGLYSGDVRAHGSWSNFKSWVTSQYGITVA